MTYNDTSNITNAFKYTKSSEIDSWTYTGETNTYSGGGYVFRMQQIDDKSSSSLISLQQLKWINEQTAALFIEFTLFNPQVNLFQHCSILIEITSAGSFVLSSQFTPISLYDLNSPSLISLQILFYLIYLAFVCLLIINELRTLMKTKWSYFRDSYNYFDLAIIGFSWSAFAFFLYRIYAANVIYHTLEQTKTNKGFINFQYVASCQYIFEYLMGACVFFSSLRFIKVILFCTLKYYKN